MYQDQGVEGLGCISVKVFRVRVCKSWGVLGLGCIRVRVFKGKGVEG